MEYKGVISHDSQRKNDFLYRVSLKCLVRNEQGDILVVKESGRTWWDLPGGGMDHGESIKRAIAREMKEEVNFEGDFTYRAIAVDEPAVLTPHNMWQIRLIFEVTPNNLTFGPGDDGDQTAFMAAALFKDSDVEVERRIFKYDTLARQ